MLKVVDRTLVASGLVEAETIPLDIVINNNYYEFVIFNVMNIGRH